MKTVREVSVNELVAEDLSIEEDTVIFPETRSAIIGNLDKLTSEAVGKYEKIGEVGDGGMKRVIKARDKDTARNLAMALLSEQDETGAQSSRFVREARITANLEHPNIVPIHDIGVRKDGTPYFTMKFLEGETLARLLMNIAKDVTGYREKYNIQHLLRIFLSICNAVEFAHSKGIAHLDLKPDNIQIGDYGEVLVLDWGLAKLIDAPEDELNSDTDRRMADPAADMDMEKTLDGEIKGTPGFMAPEQASGENSSRDEKTDIYALGAILYTILSLARPIPKKNVNEALKDTIEGNIIPIQERVPGRKIPKPLIAVVGKAMALKKEDRYDSVAEIKNEIDAFLGGFVTKAEGASLIRHCELMIKRNKLTSAFIALFLGALLVVAGLLTLFQTKRTAQWDELADVTPTSREQFANDWIPVKGNWGFNKGKIIALPGKGNSFILFLKKKVQGNIAVEFDAEIPDKRDLSPSADLSVILDGSLEHPKDVGYYMQLGGIDNTSAIIQKRGGFISTINFSLQACRKYRVRAEKVDDTLKLYCDGVPLLSVRDIFYLQGGRVGLYTFGKGKVFSNIAIYRRGVPELVPPTIEGDAFYRESRSADNASDKIKFLELARKAYSKVYESHPNSKLGAQALLKRAYVSGELPGRENFLSALRDTVLLHNTRDTLELMLLEGELYFRGNDLVKAYAAFAKAIDDYPGSAISTAATLMSAMTPAHSERMCPELRQNFWRLCAENDKSPVLRCANRNLRSLDFLRGLRFKLVDCSDNKIFSLAPLKGMPLEKLDCAGNEITSLVPLKGMNLVSLECHDNKKLSDISAIAGMRLKTLSLSGCDSITSLEPISKCVALERLTVPAKFADSPIIKALPNLKYLNTKWDAWKTTKDEFFEK